MRALFRDTMVLYEFNCALVRMRVRVRVCLLNPCYIVSTKRYTINKNEREK
jgi:hypothetical protein